MAEVINMQRKPTTHRGRVYHQGSGGVRPIARIDLSRPGATDALGEVAADWLYAQCSDDGKRKLLAEHNLLAA